MKTYLAAAVLFAMVTLPGSLRAQEPERPDSVLIQLRRLQRRLDSLERTIAELRAARKDTTSATDALAALRAAARRAAGANQPQAKGGDQAQSRTRNLQRLNPEISVTGDVVGDVFSPDGETARFTAVPREFEFSFQAALDPYTHTKVFGSKESDFPIAGFEAPGALPAPGDTAIAADEEPSTFKIEEGYMYWVGLPGGLGLKVGKFRQELGLYNRWHTHALFEISRPLATMALLGEEGLIQTGASLTLPPVTVGRATQTLVLEVTHADNEVLFGGNGDASYLGRFQNFWDLGSNSYVQFGATGLYGRHDGMNSRLLDLDFALRWIPGGNVLYHDFQLKGQWYIARRDRVGPTDEGSGGYVQASYKATQRWILGTRVDYVDGYGTDPTLVQVVPSLTWWQSEWVRLRLQYNYLKPNGLGANHTVLMQFVWAIGPHKHETY